MNKNTPILSCDINIEDVKINSIQDVYNAKYSPLGIIDSSSGNIDKKNLNSWWKKRSIPASRQNIDKALDYLNLDSRDKLLLKGYSLSLSDQYWLNPGGKMSWGDINFFTNEFSDDVGDILMGENSDKMILDLRSPDNSSDGWLAKRWKIIDGERYLFKGGSEPYYQEPVNESICSYLLKLISLVPFVDYEIVNKGENIYSACKNFVNVDTEYVTAWQIYKGEKKPNHISSYNHFLNRCNQLGIHGAKEYLDFLLTFDYLIGNQDRHMGNFGVIRNVETLEWEGFAPVFDNGTSLWYNKLPMVINQGRDIESKPFKSYHSEQIKLVDSFDNINVEKVKAGIDGMVNILSSSPYISNDRMSSVINAFSKRIDDLEEIIDKVHSRSSSDKIAGAEDRIHQAKTPEQSIVFSRKKYPGRD